MNKPLAVILGSSIVGLFAFVALPAYAGQCTADSQCPAPTGYQAQIGASATCIYPDQVYSYCTFTGGNPALANTSSASSSTAPNYTSYPTGVTASGTPSYVIGAFDQNTNATPPSGFSCPSGLTPTYWGNAWTCLVYYAPSATLPLGCDTATDYNNFACQPNDHYQYQIPNETTLPTNAGWIYLLNGSWDWTGPGPTPTTPPPNIADPFHNNSLYGTTSSGSGVPSGSTSGGTVTNTTGASTNTSAGTSANTSNAATAQTLSSPNSSLNNALSGFNSILSNISSQTLNAGTGASSNANASGASGSSASGGSCGSASATLTSSLQTLQSVAGILSTGSVSASVLTSVQNLVSAVAQVISSLSTCLTTQSSSGGTSTTGGGNSSGGSTGTTTPAPAGSVRYIKVNVPNSQSWVDFNEVQVFDANGNQISIPASGITVSGNCQNVGGYGCTSSAAALVDGNTGTGWNAGETRPGCNWANSATCALVSGETDSGYFTIDLGSPMVISRVSLLAENTPDPANATYQVLGSTDGSNFTLLATMNGTGVTTNNDWIDFVLPSGLSNVRAQGTPFKSASSFSGPPTATITVNGGSTANTGYTQEVLLSWSSQNADGATFGWTNTANCNAFIPPAFGTGIILGGPTPPLTGNKFNGQYALELACRQNGSATVTYKTSQLATGLTATASVTINVSGNGMTVMSPVYLAPSNNYSGSTGIQTQVGGIGAGSESTLPTLSVGTVPAGLTATVGAYVNQNSQIVPGTDVNALGTAPITITGSAATPPGLYIVTINSTPAFGATGYSNVTSTYEIVVGVTTSTNPTCTFNDTCNN